MSGNPSPSEHGTRRERWGAFLGAGLRHWLRVGAVLVLVLATAFLVSDAVLHSRALVLRADLAGIESVVVEALLAIAAFATAGLATRQVLRWSSVGTWPRRLARDIHRRGRQLAGLIDSTITMLETSPASIRVFWWLTEIVMLLLLVGCWITVAGLSATLSKLPSVLLPSNAGNAWELVAYIVTLAIFGFLGTISTWIILRRLRASWRQRHVSFGPWQRKAVVPQPSAPSLVPSVMTIETGPAPLVDLADAEWAPPAPMPVPPVLPVLPTPREMELAKEVARLETELEVQERMFSELLADLESLKWDEEQELALEKGLGDRPALRSYAKALSVLARQLSEVGVSARWQDVDAATFFVRTYVSKTVALLMYPVAPSTVEDGLERDNILRQFTGEKSARNIARSDLEGARLREDLYASIIRLAIPTNTSGMYRRSNEVNEDSRRRRGGDREWDTPMAKEEPAPASPRDGSASAGAETSADGASESTPP